VLLYAINIGTRTNGTEVAGTPLVLSIVAIALLDVSGWLGDIWFMCIMLLSTKRSSVKCGRRCYAGLAFVTF